MMDIDTVLPAELESTLYKLAHQCNECEKARIKCEETFDILDDAKKPFFATLVEKQKTKTSAEGERLALISTEWSEWMKGYQEARRNARQAKVDSESSQRLWDTCRSILSSKNSERRFT